MNYTRNIKYLNVARNFMLLSRCIANNVKIIQSGTRNRWYSAPRFLQLNQSDGTQHGTPHSYMLAMLHPQQKMVAAHENIPFCAADVALTIYKSERCEARYCPTGSVSRTLRRNTKGQGSNPGLGSFSLRWLCA